MVSNQCFICLEEGGRQRCKCSLRVHNECLGRFLESVPEHSGKCPVCKEVYTETHKIKKRIWIVREGNVFLVAYLVSCGILIITVVTFIFHNVQVLWGMSWSMLACLILVGAFMISIHCRLRMRTGRFCCIYYRIVESFSTNTNTLESEIVNI